MIEIKDMKEAPDDMLPEDYRHTLDEAISSLCEDICMHNSALENALRAAAIKSLAEACKLLDSLQPVHEPEPADPLTWLQNLKDYCCGLSDCDDCLIGRGLCDPLLSVEPQEWDLEGEA